MTSLYCGLILLFLLSSISDIQTFCFVFEQFFYLRLFIFCRTLHWALPNTQRWRAIRAGNKWEPFRGHGRPYSALCKLLRWTSRAIGIAQVNSRVEEPTAALIFSPIGTGENTIAICCANRAHKKMLWTVLHFYLHKLLILLGTNHLFTTFNVRCP